MKKKIYHIIEHLVADMTAFFPTGLTFFGLFSGGGSGDCNATDAELFKLRGRAIEDEFVDATDAELFKLRGRAIEDEFVDATDTELFKLRGRAIEDEFVDATDATDAELFELRG